MEKLNKSTINIVLCLLCVCNVSCKYKSSEYNILNKKDESVNISEYNEELSFDSVFHSKKNVERYASLVKDNLKYKNMLLCNNEVNKWLSKVDSSTIVMFSLSTLSNEYLILSAKRLELTGLMTSFYDWLLVDVNKGVVNQEEILSLSGDKKSWFIRNDTLHFILFTFGSDFYLNDHDYNNLPLDIVEYVIKGNVLKESNVENIVYFGR